MELVSDSSLFFSGIAVKSCHKMIERNGTVLLTGISIHQRLFPNPPIRLSGDEKELGRRSAAGSENCYFPSNRGAYGTKYTPDL